MTAKSRNDRPADREEPVMSVLTAGAPARGTLRYHLDTGPGRLTPAERAERGNEARAAVPRASHAVFDPGQNERDHKALVEAVASGRITAEPDL
jgi:hypothetical protein